MVKALQPHVKLTMNVASESTKAKARMFLAADQINVDDIEFVIDLFIDYNVRDYVMFVKDEADKLHVVDFVDTNYGRLLPSANPPVTEFQKKFGQCEERLAERLRLPLVTSEFACEGSGIDTNGRGTFLIIEEMALQRNPTKTRARIEGELQRTLGARKIIQRALGLIEDRRFPQWAACYRNSTLP